MTITPTILVLLLIFMRTLGMVGTAPLFGNSQVPTVWKIGISFYLTWIVDTAMPQKQLLGRIAGVTLPHFVGLAVTESLVGVAIGLMASVVFAVVQFAGELLDVQIGYSIASVVTPGIMGPVSLLANFHYILFVLWFLAVNGHYGIILALLESYRVLPFGASVFGGSLASVFLQSSASMFVLGVQLAAPVMLALFLTNVSLAVASRAVPQMNVFVVGLPATLLVGLTVLAIVMPDIVWMFQGLLTTMDTELNNVLQALGGRYP